MELELGLGLSLGLAGVSIRGWLMHCEMEVFTKIEAQVCVRVRVCVGGRPVAEPFDPPAIDFLQSVDLGCRILTWSHLLVCWC